MLTSRLATCFLAAPLAVLAATAPVDFQRDVRPILSNHCFQCHGPDAATRMAELRLDIKNEALAKRESGAAIVPGDPGASTLYKRIAAAEMPPASAHKPLSAAQIATLKRWIEQGAPWREHWSFVAPVRPALPSVKNAAWARTPLDRFILARLESAGLEPAPEANRRQLARRVSLDLTGLPPTPAAVEAFVRDPAPDAYERMVDRLLALPQWGEHRGRHWLDAARYADTHGIHIDNYREMWPYRDWVINAFNANMPFDRFTIEQLAGDLLPSPTLDQRIATGFHRCNVTTNEAGIIAEEYEAIYAKDRVDTTGAVWLGLTIGCATCHDHKFDPLSQRDHYSLAAFFRNTTQPVMDGNVSDSRPVVVVPKAEDRARWAALEAAQHAARERMSKLESGTSAAVTPVRPLEPETLAYPNETEFAENKTIKLPHQPVFENARPFTIAFWLRLPKTQDSLVLFSQYIPGNEEKKTKSRGVYFDVGARVPGFRVAGIEDAAGKEGGTLDLRAGHLDQLKEGEWTHIAVTYDGSSERQGFVMYINGKPVELQGSEPLAKVKGNFYARAPLTLGGDGAKRFFAGGALKDFRIYARALGEEEARLLSVWPRVAAGDREATRLYSLIHTHAEYRALLTKSAALVKERRDIRRRAAVTHVMDERADQKPFAHVLYRGMYDRPRDRVEPDVPGALPPMAAALPRDRLGLARWLVDASNPLTARVTVNRFWQEVFGTGLVKTAEDFGSQGDPPSHPELLDWLATEFRESGWDVKKFFRMLVTSATYRQSAVASEAARAADPDNRLLSRGPRFRMDGEMVRDVALAASGLLTPAIGGPSVRPYQPEGIWEAVAMDGSNTRFYKADKGGKLYRRSLYTFWKRSAPPASMDIFNAPTRESCTVRRERTNTPLQALVTMNDTQFIEAARALAERTMKEPDRYQALASYLLARPLDERERAIADGSYRAFLTFYDAHPAEARKLLAVGEHRSPAALPAPELAATTMLANEMMNLDEVLVK